MDQKPVAPGKHHQSFFIGVSSLAFLLVTLGVVVVATGKRTSYQGQAAWGGRQVIPRRGVAGGQFGQPVCLEEGRLCQVNAGYPCCQEVCDHPLSNGVGICFNSATTSGFSQNHTCTDNAQCLTNYCFKIASDATGYCRQSTEQPTPGPSATPLPPDQCRPRGANCSDNHLSCCDSCRDRPDAIPNNFRCCEQIGGTWLCDPLQTPAPTLTPTPAPAPPPEPPTPTPSIFPEGQYCKRKGQSCSETSPCCPEFSCHREGTSRKCCVFNSANGLWDCNY